LPHYGKLLSYTIQSARTARIPFEEFKEDWIG